MMTTLGLAAVFGAWTVMFIVLRIRHVRLARPTAVRRPVSRAGLLLQLTAYLLVFALRIGRRPAFEGGWGIDVGTAVVLASALCIAGAALVVWAQRVLDVQWSLTARLVEGHRLISTGPYAFVRHPIYAAMIVMLTGTSIALTSPLILALALAAYIPGTLVRVRAEEALLREAFGSEWEAYRRRVRALIPGVL